MKSNALTQITAKSLGAGKHADGRGLWLVKRSKAAGRWMLRLTINGKRREMGLGRWPDVPIAEARERAADARKQLRDGQDPIEERLNAKRAQNRLPLADAVEKCFTARKAELKNDGEAGRWMSPLKVHILPKIGSIPIEELDQHRLSDVLKPIWHEKPQAAAKALNRINLTLQHAAALGLDVDLQATMKTRALLGKQRHKVTHIPSMPYSDIREFYGWLKNRNSVAASALRLLILTAARTSEIRLATFDEINDDIWNLAAERTKNGKSHRIPLTDEARAIVKSCWDTRENEFLFPSYKGKPLSDAAMSKLMRDHGYKARPHGFRATFRTWVEEQTETPFEVKEAALGHSVDAGVVGAYQRSDRLEKRRALAEKWTEFIAGSSK